MRGFGFVKVYFQFEFAFFHVIQSASEESRGSEMSLYKRHFTSFRSHEIATPTSRLAMTNRVYNVLTITQ